MIIPLVPMFEPSSVIYQVMYLCFYSCIYLLSLTCLGDAAPIMYHLYTVYVSYLPDVYHLHRAFEHIYLYLFVGHLLSSTLPCFCVSALAAYVLRTLLCIYYTYFLL